MAAIRAKGLYTLLDDEMIAGSTAHELAMVLKKAGFGRIDIWACARA